MKLEEALEVVAEYSLGDRLEGLKKHIDPVWGRGGSRLVRYGDVAAATSAGRAGSLGLVIRMGLMRGAPIERVVDALGTGSSGQKENADREERDRSGAAAP